MTYNSNSPTKSPLGIQTPPSVRQFILQTRTSQQKFQNAHKIGAAKAPSYARLSSPAGNKPQHQRQHNADDDRRRQGCVEAKTWALHSDVARKPARPRDVRSEV